MASNCRVISDFVYIVVVCVYIFSHSSHAQNTFTDSPTTTPTTPTSAPTFAWYSTSTYGGTGGSAFTLVPDASNDAYVTQICVRYTSWAEAIKLYFSDGTTQSAGSTDGSSCTDVVNDGHCFTSIAVYAGTVVDSLQFTTSDGITSNRFGGSGGVYYPLTASHSYCLKGVSGRIGIRIDAISFTFAADLFTSAPTAHPTAMSIPPTKTPSSAPTAITNAPTLSSANPTSGPFEQPTDAPTFRPSVAPSKAPVVVEDGEVAETSTTPGPTADAVNVDSDRNDPAVFVYVIIGSVCLLLLVIAFVGWRMWLRRRKSSEPRVEAKAEERTMELAQQSPSTNDRAENNMHHNENANDLDIVGDVNATKDGNNDHDLVNTVNETFGNDFGNKGDHHERVEEFEVVDAQQTRT